MSETTTTEETRRWLEETAAPDYLERLRAAMKARKVTQQQLADAAGKSVSWVRVVLSGNCPYRGARQVPKGIWQAARMFGCP